MLRDSIENALTGAFRQVFGWCPDADMGPPGTREWRNRSRLVPRNPGRPSPRLRDAELMAQVMEWRDGLC